MKVAGNGEEDNVTYKGAKYKEHDKIRYQTGKVYKVDVNQAHPMVMTSDFFF